ncbi:MAG TPA: glycosyltransferase family 39 protein, partial [Chloroflexia bacterium]|nr:glycosyltransferase family 39 protein [Chloroflexia bacterium]
MRSSQRHGPWRGLLGLGGVTVLAWALALAAPSQTEVRVVLTAQGATGRVNNAKIGLDLPPGQLPATGHFGWYLAAPRESLDYQPADPQAPLVALGRLGEALQEVRPPSQWVPLPPSPGGAAATWRPLPTAPGATAAEDRSSRTVPNARVYATLVDGRGPAGLLILDAAHNGYAFLVRPERRSIAWWRVTAGVPTTLIKEDIYRPAGWATLADMVLETALALTGTWLLVLLAALLSLGWATLTRPPRGSRLPAPAPGAASPEPPEQLITQNAQLITQNAQLITQNSKLITLTMLLLALAAIAATAAIGLGPLEGIPHVQDDVAYLWQAKIFALGRAWVPAPPLPDFFDQGFILITDGRWFSKYPPGWPLLLVPGIWAGLPWLVNPLCAGASLALIYATGRRLFGPVAGFWAAALGLTSPFLLFMSGSYMSHPATMLAVAAALYCFVRMTSRQSSVVS